MKVTWNNAFYSTNPSSKADRLLVKFLLLILLFMMCVGILGIVFHHSIHNPAWSLGAAITCAVGGMANLASILCFTTHHILKTKEKDGSNTNVKEHNAMVNVYRVTLVITWIAFFYLFLLILLLSKSKKDKDPVAV